MNNLIKCPKCNGAEEGCAYCAYVGYVYNENGDHFTLTLDANNNPIKGAPVQKQEEKPSQPEKLSTGAKLFDSLFPQPEPEDLISFFKRKRD
jgi:hypothetical protein